MNVLDLEGFERFLKLIKLEVKTYRGYRIVERTFTEGIAERAVDAIEDGTIPEEDKAIFRSPHYKRFANWEMQSLRLTSVQWAVR